MNIQNKFNLGDKFYVVGQSFDPITQRWVFGNHMITSRIVLGIKFYNGKIHYKANDHIYTRRSELFSYDEEEMFVTEAEAMTSKNYLPSKKEKRISTKFNLGDRVNINYSEFRYASEEMKKNPSRMVTGIEIDLDEKVLYWTIPANTENFSSQETYLENQMSLIEPGTIT